MAKDTSNTNKASSMLAAVSTPPANVDRDSLRKQEERAKAADVPAALKSVIRESAEAVNGERKTAKRTTNRPAQNALFSKIGIKGVIDVDLLKHVARTDSLKTLKEIRTQGLLVAGSEVENDDGSIQFTYDAAKLNAMTVKVPRAASSTKYPLESSTMLGTKITSYMSYGGVQDTIMLNGQFMRTYSNVRLTGQYDAGLREGDFVLHKGNVQLRVKMTVSTTLKYYPDRYALVNGEWVIKPELKAEGTKSGPNRDVFVMSVQIRDAAGAVSTFEKYSEGVTNTLNGILNKYDMIVFPDAPVAAE